ncbi:DsbA family oxidoreductase [Nonomuraea sp. KC401]|uniref:DsbA family oxidoreductase n=1 Tax=unclassified Nonomuraea TaxID=2593643 RepID=UPI0010FF0455|nr:MULTISPECIES: DsbA family oxidoreductase [unclassified Nonomuraea]NBE94503.1 DsbA family oxidoreductase [Nonomuraea sp. K271]TLF64042.1 DsbA family oxidoreductase [Nonomuraea sp. KC401]
MNVEVYSDIACPWCRLGTYQFHRAVAATGATPDVDLVHRPYLLDPDAPEEPRPLTESVIELFGPEQAEAMLTGMTRLGADEGIEYRFDRAVAVSTLTAHRLLWLALNEHGAKVQAALATALFDAHFRDGVNIADHASLTDLAERAGLDGGQVRTFLTSGEGVAEVRDQAAAARRDGVTTVPRFVFENGEVIVGATSTEALGDALRKAAAG